LGTKTTNDLAEGTSPRLYFTNTRADDRINLQKGIPGGLATLDGTGKIPAAQLPGEATVDAFVVASEAAMLALVAQKGDLAKRTDTKELYVLRVAGASVLANWELLSSDYGANVETVNGQTRAVVLTTSEISEGTNLYWTAARFDTRLAAKSTSDLAEGSNLYYTTSRANADFDTRLAVKSTSDLAEGVNLYYTTVRANPDFDTRLGTKSTSDLAEGVNLYYTAARFNTAFSGKSTSDLGEGTNLYYTAARFDTRLGTKTTTDLSEGVNLYFTNTRADDRISLQKGAANGIATLDSDSKVPYNQLPAIAITDTFVVASQAAMLAAAAQTGDVAVRTDLNKSYILGGTDPTLLSDWQELLTPTDAVLSVNSQTGIVTLTTSDVAEGTNLYFTTTRARGAISATTPVAYDGGTGVVSLGIVPVSLGGTNASTAASARANLDARRQHTNLVVVQSLSDFPAPVAGVITLAPDTDYEICGTVNIGANSLVMANNVTVSGLSCKNDGLVYTGTGTFITSVSNVFGVRNLLLTCATGTLFDISGTGMEHVDLQGLYVTGAQALGNLASCHTIKLNDSIIRDTTTSGFTVSGAALENLTISQCYLDNNAGTFLALGSSTVSTIDIIGNICEIKSAQVLLSGSAPIVNTALVSGNQFKLAGTGAVLSGLTVNDPKWLYLSNFGLGDTSFGGECYMVANAVATNVATIGAYLKVAGTTTSGFLANFTHSAPNQLTYTGLVARTFFLGVGMSVSCAANNNQVVGVQFFKNGTTPIPSSIIHTRCQTATQPYFLFSKTLLTLNPGDYIEVWITNETSTNSDPTVEDMNFSIR